MLNTQAATHSVRTRGDTKAATNTTLDQTELHRPSKQPCAVRHCVHDGKVFPSNRVLTKEKNAEKSARHTNTVHNKLTTYFLRLLGVRTPPFFDQALEIHIPWATLPFISLLLCQPLSSELVGSLATSFSLPLHLLHRRNHRIHTCCT